MTQRAGRQQLRGTLFLGVWVTILTTASAGLYAHGPLHEQIEGISRHIEEQPRNARLYLRRGELYRLDENAAAAEADYERAARLDPALHEVHLALGQLHFDEGHAGKALTHVNVYLTYEPDRADAIFLRARALAELDRRHDAIRAMDRAIERTSKPLPVHYLERARLAVQSTGDAIDRAILGLDEGIARLGPVATLQWYAIDLEAARGRYDEALVRLDRLATQYNRKEVLLKRRGELLETAGRWMEAQAAYTEALDAVDALSTRTRHTSSTMELESFLRNKLRATGPEMKTSGTERSKAP